MINRDLRQKLSTLKHYTELRLHENRDLSMFLLDGNLVRNDKSATGGVSARVFNNGYWGFSSSAEMTDDAIDAVILAATENAAFLASKGQKSIEPFLPEPIQESRDYATQKERWTQEHIVQYLTQIDTFIKESFPDLASRMIALMASDMEKNTVTTNHVHSYLNWPRTVLYIQLTKVKGEEPFELYEVLGGIGHLEDALPTLEDIKPKIEALYTSLCKKTEGIFAEAGLHDVILDADLAGILAHEAIGHTVEADLVRNGSIAGDFLGKVVASPLVSLVDFAHTYNGELLPTPIFVDDEGVAAKDCHIIENGVLKAFMHNRDSARQFNHANSGNARAYRYSDEPLIRMRNTAILPGTSTLEDMIASIEKGYYFVKTNNGQADTTGEFMFGVVEGYEIIDGKLGKAIKDTTIAGKAFDVLKTVTMISNEMKWGSGGMCGKKQPIPVSMGGPAIKCKINVGGR